MKQRKPRFHHGKSERFYLANLKTIAAFISIFGKNARFSGQLTGLTEAEYKERMVYTRAEFIEAAVCFGMTRKQATELANVKVTK